MNLTIKKLTPELSDDYFDFFENRAFTDDSPYRCYCQIYQLSKEQYKAIYDKVGEADLGRVSRDIAESQIKTGVLQGYLAYSDSVSIGWCNCNDRANYPSDSYIETNFHAPADKREKAVICFEIAPEYRGKGVATALLQHVIDDAKADNYIAVEGFPVERSERFEWDYSGPIRLYEKFGFVRVEEKNRCIVMRKELL